MVVGVGSDRLASGLCRQRESGEFCDVLITVADALRITAHSNVLAISSIYFSDIARKPSPLLPHIPSTRTGGHVSLSVVAKTDLDKDFIGVHPVAEVRAAVPGTAPNEPTPSSDGCFYDQSAVQPVAAGPIVFSVEGTPDLVTVLRKDLCSADMSPAVLASGGDCGATATLQSLIGLPETVVAAPFEGSSSCCLTAVDAGGAGALQQAVSDASLSPNVPEPAGRPGPIERPRRRRDKQSSFKYELELGVVDGGTLELDCLADCVRLLVDFAYCCGPLAITETTYPVLHDLAKLLQMEEAVSLCEKHAVDRLVGCSPEPPAAAETELEPEQEQEPEPEQEQEQEQGHGRPSPAGSRLRVCRSCSFVCHGAARMIEHRRMHHVRSYMCGFCGVTRQKTSQLLRHLIEAEHGETVCSLCFHECGPGERMAEHYLRHNDPRPFFCSVCFARFPSRTGLNLHMPTHSSIKPFVCRTCGQAFKWRHALQSHARTHGAEKKLLCDVCGFCTRHTGQFKAHKARHAGTTEPCPHEGCAFRATTTWLLKDHLVTHAAEKQYQCEVCGKKFGHVRNMRRHALLHDQQVALSCERCPYQTTRSDKLAQHVRVKHAAAAPSGDGGAVSSEPTGPAAAGGRRPQTTKRRRKGAAAVTSAGDGSVPRPAGRRPVPILAKEVDRQGGRRTAGTPRRRGPLRRLLPRPVEGPAPPV